MGKRKKKGKPDSRAADKPQEVQFRPLHGALQELRATLQTASPTPAKSKEPTSTPAKPEAKSSKSIDQKTYDERMALQQAYRGVKRLSSHASAGATPPERAPQPPPDRSPREDAMRPVQRMVADGVRFVVEEDEGGVRAYRASRGKQALEPLKKGNATPEASLDLHGFREEAARQMLQRWVRSERERRRHVVRIIHGQGHHSAGSAVLRDAVRSELESGLCAAYVDAFATATPKQGGQGALLVALKRR